MMQVQPIRAGNIVILHPGRTVAVRARHEYPVQGGDEHRPLHRELEGAISQQIAKHIGDAEPFPYFAKQQRSADALGLSRQRGIGVFVQRVDERHLIGQLGSRSEQGGQRSGSAKLIGAAKSGDDRLTHGAIDALVFDDLHIGAFAGLFEAEEHGSSQQDTMESDSASAIKRIK